MIDFRNIHKSPVQSNVAQFTNFYQKKGGGTTFDLYLNGTLNSVFPIFADDETLNPPLGGLVGDNSIASDAPKTAINITTDRAGIYAGNVDDVRGFQINLLYTPGVPHHDADLTGNGVQHDMITWYVRQDVLNDLQ